jgi:hypothetical protein
MRPYDFWRRTHGRPPLDFGGRFSACDDAIGREPIEAAAQLMRTEGPPVRGGRIISGSIPLARPSESTNCDLTGLSPIDMPVGKTVLDGRE